MRAMAARALLLLLCIPAVVFLGLQLHSVRLDESALDVIQGKSANAAEVARAQRLLERAGEHNPTSEPEFRKAQLLSFAGRPAQAVAVLRAIVRDEPDHLPAWILLARVADESGDATLAEQARDRAQALNPRAGRLAR
jgi:predicted Zn-dependent protease